MSVGQCLRRVVIRCWGWCLVSWNAEEVGLKRIWVGVVRVDVLCWMPWWDICVWAVCVIVV